MRVIIQNSDTYGLFDSLTVSYPMSKIIEFINRVIAYYQQCYLLENKLNYTPIAKSPYFDNYNMYALSIVINVIVDEYYDIVLTKGFKFTNIFLFPKETILLEGQNENDLP